MTESMHPRTDEIKEILGNFTKAELEVIAQKGFEEATTRFLNDKFAAFGRYTFWGVMATFLTFIVGVGVFGFAWLNGWRPH
jgi:hypothetical protein